MTYEKIMQKAEVKRWIRKHKKELSGLSIGLLALVCYSTGIAKGKDIQAAKDGDWILSFVDKNVNDLIKDIFVSAYRK